MGYKYGAYQEAKNYIHTNEKAFIKEMEVERWVCVEFLEGVDGVRRKEFSAEQTKVLEVRGWELSSHVALKKPGTCVAPGLVSRGNCRLDYRQP